MGFAPTGEVTPMKTTKRFADIADIADMPRRKRTFLAERTVDKHPIPISAKSHWELAGMSAMSAMSAKQGSSPEPGTSIETGRFQINVTPEDATK
jgi:hypothetical protein